MLPLIGLGIGVAGAIGKMIGRGKANKRMAALMAQNPAYEENPLAKQRLGLAQTLLNARAPGAVMAERNIQSNQANNLARMGRNTTDASQLLAMGANAVTQSNEAYNELATNEAQDYQRRFSNVVGAQEGVINEQTKVFNDEVRRFQDNVQMQGAMNENKQNTWGDISNMGFGLMDFGMSGGFGKLFGGGGNKTPDAGISSNPWSGSQGRKIDYGLINSTYPKI